MSAAAVQAPPVPSTTGSTDRNFYCHVCATEVVGLASAANGGEVECGQCHSNFVEAVGQGYETFVNPGPGPSAPVTRRTRTPRTVTTYTSHQGRDQRTPPLSPPPEASGFPGANGPGGLRTQTFPPAGVVVSSRSLGNGLGVEIVSFASGGRGGVGGMGAVPPGVSSLVSALLGMPSRGGNGGGGGGDDGAGTDNLFRGPLGMRNFDDLLHHIMMNENSRAGAPPAPDVVIESLERVVVNADTNLQQLGECSISQEAFVPGDTAISLPCGHSFKQEPILHWLRMHNTCPVCRVALPTLDDDDDA